MPRKDNFFRTYANLPINVRKEVVLNIDTIGPITWEVAYREIDADTELGKVILQKLVDLGVILGE